jgi:hypothetical protein
MIEEFKIIYHIIKAWLPCNYGWYLYMENTYQKIIDFYLDKTVDTSHLYLDEGFEGLEDYVLIDKNTRTCFGTFEEYYSNELKRWNEPLCFHQIELLKSIVLFFSDGSFLFELLLHGTIQTN